MALLALTALAVGVFAQSTLLTGSWDFAPAFGVAPPARYQYAITVYEGDPVRTHIPLYFSGVE